MPRALRPFILLASIAAIMCFAWLNSSTASSSTATSAADLTSSAVSADPAIATDAIAKLREQGPFGLATLMSANTDEIRRHIAQPRTNRSDPAWQRLSSALDAVAAQRDAYTSGLYWYTDFEAAKTASKAAGKPILSLRLLGKLNEEFSCANSRFFRTALYANADVSKVLREHFILHWQSVRPVPKITIDFGDGRKVERTITGNSIHYVLDSNGNVIDAIPGLYGPKAFLRELSTAEQALDQSMASGVANRQSFLVQWHGQEAQRLAVAWREDLQSVGAPPIAGVSSDEQSLTVSKPPTAAEAARRAMSKSIVEVKLVRAVTPGPVLSTTALQASTADATWSKIAALHAEDAALDTGSRSLMAAKQPDAAKAAVTTFSKMRAEDPLIRTVAKFQRSIAEDTVRNEYLFHRQIHEWLADPGNGRLSSDVNILNERVYTELFLTPSSDPWLGLAPANTYSGLDNDGTCPISR